MNQLKLKTFQQISENGDWARGDYVSRKANPRHKGHVYQILRGGSKGTTVSVKWNNGWKEHLVKPKEINRAKHEFETDDEITQIKKWMKARSNKK
jgi:hypothetical protein